MITAIILAPIALLMTGIGIYALRREKPMWFWAGTEIKSEEITDVRAYNRSNAVMWFCYSAVFWAGVIAAPFSAAAAGIIAAAGGIGGAFAMMLFWRRIYEKYSKK